MVIIDGFEGKVYIEPDQTTMTKMQEKQKMNQRKAETLERLKGKENVTQSGQKIDVSANITSKEDIENVIRNDAKELDVFEANLFTWNPEVDFRRRISSSKSISLLQNLWEPNV